MLCSTALRLGLLAVASTAATAESAFDPGYHHNATTNGDDGIGAESNETSLFPYDDDDGYDGHNGTETGDPGRCEANPRCSALGLEGACCPATSGAMMSCCDDSAEPSSGGAGGLAGSFLARGGIAAATLVLLAAAVAV